MTITEAGAALANEELYATGGAYVNFLMPDDGAARIREVYGGNHDRLMEVKRRYDPQNLFRVNHNIDP